MKLTRIENLVSWMWAGAALIGVGLFFVIRGWFFTELGMPPVHARGTLDPHLALGGGILFFAIGAVIVIAAIVARLRQR